MFSSKCCSFQFKLVTLLTEAERKSALLGDDGRLKAVSLGTFDAVTEGRDS